MVARVSQPAEPSTAYLERQAAEFRELAARTTDPADRARYALEASLLEKRARLVQQQARRFLLRR